MRAEREESFLGTVARRTQPVGAEPDPGEKGNQRELVEDFRILNVAGRADQNLAESPLFRAGVDIAMSPLFSAGLAITIY